MTAPIIVTATLGPRDFGWLDALRRAHFPPERNVLLAHLTLFHHLPPSLEAEINERLAGAVRAKAPVATIGEPWLLGQGVAFRVRAPELEAIREELAEAFRGMLTPQDQAGWRPHVTIQNKAEPAKARALHQVMQSEFPVPRPLSMVGLASWHYRGGPWEPIADYRFWG